MNDIHDDAAFEVAASDVLPEAAMLEGADPDASRGGEPASSLDRRRSAQSRIDEVTRARREAERERDYWRERASGGGEDDRKDLPGGGESIDPGSRDPAGRNERDGDEENVDPRDLIQEVREQLRAELIAEAAAFEAQESARGAAAVWEDRQAAFASVRPDYVEAVMGSDWACSDVMADAIQDSDAGPALAYHLASYPEQAAAIAAMSPLAQVRALGRIEAGLIEGSVSRAGTAISISAAPAPPPSLRGSGGRFRPAPDTDDFAAFDRAYGAR